MFFLGLFSVYRVYSSIAQGHSGSSHSSHQERWNAQNREWLFRTPLVVEDGLCKGDVGAKSHGGELAVLAQFDGGHNLIDGVCAEIVNQCLEFSLEDLRIFGLFH